MNTLNLLFESLNPDHTSDTPELKAKWEEIATYLYEHCSESVREDIMTFLLEYSHLSEQQAYAAGFRQAFQIWLDALREPR
jgi:hypothetical protein